jgi:ubiquinone/menaquinone biosynthesis C-methylase UbiE
MPEWWRTYFGDDFFQLHRDLFPEQESRAEVAALLELMGLPAGARILDVPCGWGRHTHLLAEAGFAAVGADLSEPLLQRALAAADAQGTRAFAACDIRALPFADACMDAAINVFTSLGLFASDEDDRNALCEIRRVLRPGGLFLLETMHRDEVISAYAERDRWTLPDGTEVRVRRRFDPVTALSHECLQWRRDSESGEKRHTLRLRTATEVAALLQSAGFRDIDYYGGWDGSALTHRSPHLIALARVP